MRRLEEACGHWKRHTAIAESLIDTCPLDHCRHVDTAPRLVGIDDAADREREDEGLLPGQVHVGEHLEIV